MFICKLLSLNNIPDLTGILNDNIKIIIAAGIINDLKTLKIYQDYNNKLQTISSAYDSIIDNNVYRFYQKFGLIIKSTITDNLSSKFSIAESNIKLGEFNNNLIDVYKQSCDNLTYEDLISLILQVKEFNIKFTEIQNEFLQELSKNL